jgi:shikimate dehydrogenase
MVFMTHDPQWQIDTGTVLYGVFGDPIKHSKSPLMLGRAFRAEGINAVYAAFHIVPGQLKAAVDGVRALGFRGINVTLPHKEEIMRYMDEIDAGARVIGAVNTVVNHNGTLIGYNTDGIGYVRSLKEETGLTLEGKRILILGARGAARGVGYALAQERPASIMIANRTEEKAQELAEDLSRYCECEGMGWKGIDNLKQRVDLIVNTTSVGMHPNIDETPIDTSWLREGITVSDIVYNPRVTKLLQEAGKRGCTIHEGLGMFIYQGAYAFEYWTGRKAPVAVMREAVEQSFL